MGRVVPDVALEVVVCIARRLVTIGLIAMFIGGCGDDSSDASVSDMAAPPVDGFSLDASYPGEGEPCFLSLDCEPSQICVDDSCTRHERVSTEDLEFGEVRTYRGEAARSATLYDQAPISWDELLTEDTVSIGDTGYIAGVGFNSWLVPGEHGPQLVFLLALSPANSSESSPDHCQVGVFDDRGIRVVAAREQFCRIATATEDGRVVARGTAGPIWLTGEPDTYQQWPNEPLPDEPSSDEWGLAFLKQSTSVLTIGDRVFSTWLARVGPDMVNTAVVVEYGPEGARWFSATSDGPGPRADDAIIAREGDRPILLLETGSEDGDPATKILERYDLETGERTFLFAPREDRLNEAWTYGCGLRAFQPVRDLWRWTYRNGTRPDPGETWLCEWAVGGTEFPAWSYAPTSEEDPGCATSDRTSFGFQDPGAPNWLGHSSIEFLTCARSEDAPGSGLCSELRGIDHEGNSVLSIPWPLEMSPSISFRVNALSRFERTIEGVWLGADGAEAFVSTWELSLSRRE